MMILGSVTWHSVIKIGNAEVQEGDSGARDDTDIVIICKKKAQTTQQPAWEVIQ